TWSISAGTGTASINTSGVVSGLTAGTVTVEYTITNGSGCKTKVTAPLTINALPSAPTVGTITHPTCALVTGSVVLNGLPTGNWIINPGNISGSTASTTISGLSAGTTFNYTVTVDGCTSGTVEVIINNYVCPIFENGTIASTGGEVFANIASNDKVNGVPAVLGTTGNATVAISGTWPTGITLDPATGKVTVAAGTAPGTYNVVYELCDKLTPVTCATVSNEIKVTAIVEPVLENGTIPSTGGTVFVNIASNDKVNGVSATLGTTGNATVSVSGTWPTGITLDPATGKVTVAAGTAPGTYTVVYELCDKLTPVTCATVSNEIKVTAVVAPIFENGTIASTGGTVFANIAGNDKVNGVPAVLGTTGNASVSVSGTWPTGITLDPATGKVIVAAGTAPGTYNVVYELCDKLTPQTCATVSNEIKVTAVVAPLFENGTIPSTGGDVFANIASNDTVNGVPAVLGTTGNASVAVSGTWPTGITLDPATGKVTVAAGTTPGTYNVVYTLCDKLTPVTCATVSNEIIVTPVTIFVASPSIALVKTAHFNDENGDGYAKVGETITYNFAVTNTGNVALTNVFVVDPLTGVTMTGGPINLAVGQEDTTSFTGAYSIVQADINLGSISNQAEVSGTGPNDIVVRDKSDSSSILDDSPTVLPISGCVIKVFNAISPNGDTKNARFYIQGLECYPDNTVEIYNRWGVLVYERDHYDNVNVVFRGFSEGRVTVASSDGLPVGTYYYVLKYKDSESNAHQQAGYLYLGK
ncbi:T9SS type B sorting domain-containing protein, partial [Flavobacterium laiguense]